MLLKFTWVIAKEKRYFCVVNVGYFKFSCNLEAEA